MMFLAGMVPAPECHNLVIITAPAGRLILVLKAGPTRVGQARTAANVCQS